MDIYKLISHILLLLTVLISVAQGGKKYRHHHKSYPIKPLFGVGVGYKKVVSYKPVIVFQKHKHVKLKHRPVGWGWHHGGWHHGGWGWKPQVHHGKRGHSGWGGGHKHNIDHHHYHHNDGGWGGWAAEDGGGGDGGGGGGYNDDHDDYGGWESNLRANWSSPIAKIADQMPGYSDQQGGGGGPSPVEMRQARTHGHDLTSAKNVNGNNDPRLLPTSATSSEENGQKSQEIINQGPPPLLQGGAGVGGGYNSGNYANFNLGPPLINHPLPSFARIARVAKISTGKRESKGVSIPLVGGGLPFYAQNFPTFTQFQAGGIRQF